LKRELREEREREREMEEGERERFKVRKSDGGK